MRKFTLINESGQEFDLNTLDAGLLKSISGVGFEKEYSYVRNGNRWVRNKLDPKQVPFKGEIVIASHDPYAGEAGIISFLRNTTDMRLRYETTQGTWYKDVDIVTYDKSEIQHRALTIPVVLMPKSQWTVRMALSPTLDGETEDEKYYNTEYSYDYSYNENSSGVITITNHSSLEAEFAVVFNGPISNPSILVTNNGRVIGDVDITGSCLEGETIEYSCCDRDDGTYCIKRSGNEITNLVGGFDITKTNWFHLAPGQNVVTFTADQAISNPIVITVYESYEVV